MKKSQRTGCKIGTTNSEVSKLYTPTERNISDEAKICLDCDLPECIEPGSTNMKCPRLKSELQKLREAKKKQYNRVKI